MSQQEYDTTAGYLEPLQRQAELAKQDVLRELEPVRHDISNIKGALEHNPKSSSRQTTTLQVCEEDLDLRHLETENVTGLKGEELMRTVNDLDDYGYQLKMEYAVHQRVLDVVESWNEPLPDDEHELVNRLLKLEKPATQLPQKTREKVVESFYEESGGGYSFGEEEVQQRRALFENSDGPFPALKGAALSIERIRNDMHSLEMQ